MAMKNRRFRAITHIVCVAVAAVSLLIATANTALSRQSGPSSAPPIKDPKAEIRERQNRETGLRSAEVGAALEKRDEKRMEAAIEQMKQDFKRLQIVRNEMARNVLANKPFDYKVISSEAEEINKRSNRLKTFLMPPTPEDKEKSQKNEVEYDDDAMKGALVKLCNLIDSFVENPILKTPGVTNVEQSTKAGHDLMNIIELSSNVKRSAEKLHKSPK